MSEPLSYGVRLRLIAELDARTKPLSPPEQAQADLGALARGLGQFGRTSEHDHRLALERKARP